MALTFNWKTKRDGHRLACIQVTFGVTREDVHLTVEYLAANGHRISRTAVEREIRSFASSHGHAWQIAMGDDTFTDEDSTYSHDDIRDLVDELFPELRAER